MVHLHLTHTTVVHLVLGPYPLHLQFILVVLDLQRIMVIPKIEFKFPLVLLAHTALLMHTPGSQLAMAHQTIEKLAGNIVSGKGVEICDATLDQCISTMGHLHHLEFTRPVNIPYANTTIMQLLGFKTNSTSTTQFCACGVVLIFPSVSVSDFYSAPPRLLSVS